METETRRKPIVDQVFGDNKAPITEVLNADFSGLKSEIDAFVERMRSAAKSAPKNEDDQAALGKIIIEARGLFNKADGHRETEKRPIIDTGKALDAWFKDALSKLIAGRDHLQTMADAYTRKKAAEARAEAQRIAEEARKKADDERAKAEAAQTASAAGRAEGRAEALDQKAEAAEARADASAADLTRTRVAGVTASAKGAWVARVPNDPMEYQKVIAPLGAVGMFIKREALEAAFNAMAKTQKGGAAWPGVTFEEETKATFRR
jgi:chemotaxis protein histidine kinase CheA